MEGKEEARRRVGGGATSDAPAPPEGRDYLSNAETPSFVYNNGYENWVNQKC